MRAIRITEFGGPERLVLTEVPDPVAGPGEVLVEVLAAAVNPVDTYIRTGTYSLVPELPYTPGLEGCGRIVALGEGVEGWQIGQRVVFERPRTGAYAELAAVPSRNLLRAPERLDDAQCAGFWVAYATAYRALVQIGGARPGQTLLVHGASGGVGLATLEIARTMGLRVAGTASTAEGHLLIKRRGATPFSHAREDYLEQMLERTGGVGFDLIVEMAAGTNLMNDFGLLAPRGKVMIVGSHGALELTPRAMMGKEVSAHGVMLFGMTPDERAEAGAALFGLAETGALVPQIAHSLPLEDASKAHELIGSRGKAGKIVLTAG